MWFTDKIFNLSVVSVVLLMKQLHILFQNATTTAEGVQTSETSQRCQNASLEAM